MKSRDEAAAKVAALGGEDASALLPLLKPGVARASLLAMPVSQAALVMEGCTPEELGSALSALVRAALGWLFLGRAPAHASLKPALKPVTPDP